jgi:tetratricopeptide (TPR) repeat protein
LRKQLERTRRPPFPNGYTVREAARLLDVPPGRVYEYVRADFLSPRRGPRGEYRFTFQDLVLLRTAKELTQRLSPRRVKRALANLKQQLPTGSELTRLRITSDGESVVARDGTTAWIPESGQTLLDFEVAELAAAVAPSVRPTAQVRCGAGSQMAAEDWYEMGCELEECDTEQATDAYRRAVELDPSHVDAHVNVGRLLHEAGDRSAAESHYRAALELEPADATAAYNLGVLLEDLGRRAEAVGAYVQAIEADSEYADAHYNLAHLYEELGRKQSAVKHLQIYRRLVD